MKKRINPSPQLTRRQRFLRAATRWWILIGLWAMNYLSFAVIDATSWNPLQWSRECRYLFVAFAAAIQIAWLGWLYLSSPSLRSEPANPNPNSHNR